MKKLIERMMLRKMNQMMGRYETLGPMKKGMIAFFMHAWPGQISCKKFDAFLSEFIDGSLPESVTKLMQFHIKVCPMCRRHHHDMEATVALVRGLDDESCTDGVPQDVINAVLIAMANDEEDDGR